jgi:hypothetical protein
MCIIVYKKEDVKMPSEKILKNCFENHPDGFAPAEYYKVITFSVFLKYLH